MKHADDGTRIVAPYDLATVAHLGFIELRRLS